MDLFNRIKKFIDAMKYAINPPSDLHETLMRNLKARIEQEKIRENWCKAVGKDPTDDGYTLYGRRIDKEELNE